MKTVAVLVPHYWPDVEHMLRLAAADCIIVDDHPRAGCFGPLSTMSRGSNATAIFPRGALSVPLVPGDYEEIAKTAWRSEHIDQLSKWYPGKLLHLSEPYQLIAAFPRDFDAGTTECLKWLLTLLPPRKGRKTVFTAEIEGFAGDVEHLVGYSTAQRLVHPSARTATLDADRVSGKLDQYLARTGPLPVYGGNRGPQYSYSILDLLAQEGETRTRKYLAKPMAWGAL
jgi:hypothetical protein